MKNWSSVRLLHVVRLICCLLNTGFTVHIFHRQLKELISSSKLASTPSIALKNVHRIIIPSKAFVRCVDMPYWTPCYTKEQEMKHLMTEVMVINYGMGR